MMKRIIYITLAAVALLLSACSERPIDPMPQVPGSTGSYIFFEPEVIESVETKTTMVEGTTLPGSFGVYGYAGSQTLFNGKEVYKNADGYFTYDNLVRWVDGTTTHNFYAYYPYDLKDSYTISVGTDKIPYIEYVQPEDQEDMIDILTASYGNTKQSYVELDFRHRLWALDITVENKRVKNDSIYNPSSGQYEKFSPVITVKDIKIELQEIPYKANIYTDRVDHLTFPNPEEYCKLTYTFSTNKELTPLVSNKFTVNDDSYLFLPCASFKYRLTVAFENKALGLTYIAHHPSTYEVDNDGNPVDNDGNPVLNDDELQWHWATAKGPSAAGFSAGHKYTLDIVKSDFDMTFKWETAPWEEVKVDHTFN